MIGFIPNAYRAACNAVFSPTVAERVLKAHPVATAPPAFVREKAHAAMVSLGAGWDETAKRARAFMAKPVAGLPISTYARLTAGALALHDVVPNGSLDTLTGCLGAMYASNSLFTRLVGTNLKGLDTALLMSFGSFHMFRVYAGAKLTDLSSINFNEAFLFRFIAELGNYLTMIPMLGRLYLRSDLRGQLAQEHGMVADANVGARVDYGWLARKVAKINHLPQSIKNALQILERIPQTPLLGLVIDVTLGRLMRILAPQKEGAWLRPITLWRQSSSHPALQKLGRFFMKGHGGKNSNDLMRPQMTGTGRLLTLSQGLAINIPYQGALALVQGMDTLNWMKNRIWKMTLWSFLGQPTKVRLGGDLPRAQIAGFVIGMLLMDLPISLFFNPRFDQREWALKFHDALSEVHLATGSNTDAVVTREADRILDQIVVDQMTAWDLSDAASHLWNTGEWRIGYYQSKFLGTLADEVAQLTPSERDALIKVALVLKTTRNPTKSIEQEGIGHLRFVLYSVPPQ